MSSAARMALVVEDDEALADLFGELVAELDLTAWRASTIADAIARLGDDAFVVAIVDCFVGGESCEPLLAALAARKDEEGVPGVLLVSASPSCASLAARWQVPFLAKPFDIEAFGEHVKNAAARRSRPVAPAS